MHPSGSWLNPFDISTSSALVAGVLVAVFIYWGWDSRVSVNEETEDTTQTPGKAAVIATRDPGRHLRDRRDRGSGVPRAASSWSTTGRRAQRAGHRRLRLTLDKLLIIAVLTSASASTQTTILPTSRTTLSMAVHGAIPKYLGRVHPRFLTPDVSTIWMGVVSIVWYVGLTLVSENILFDSIAALGLMIAFYYGLTGFACVVYFRRALFKSVRNFFLAGVAPLIGGLMLAGIFVKSCIDLSKPENSESGDSWFGIGPPLVIAIGFLIMGIVFMLLCWWNSPEFFRRKIETADPEVALYG